MIEIEQQTRLDREERAHGQAQANKELVRNLAHEIKNPLGGIRGAAQLLEMELTVARADRVHPGHHPRGRPPAGPGGPPAGAAPPPHVVGDVNIHEVCERVRSLILAEYPRGLASSATTTPPSPSSAATASS
jgi:two-component system nitrogen regulation sensor histidine kinase GlnL